MTNRSNTDGGRLNWVIRAPVGFRGLLLSFVSDWLLRIWLTCLLPQMKQTSLWLVIIAVAGKAGRTLCSIWGLSDCLASLTVCRLMLCGLMVKFVWAALEIWWHFNNYWREKERFCKQRLLVEVTLLRSCRLTGTVSKIVTYIRGRGKREHIPRDGCPGMCFCFHHPFFGCIPFPCVVRDGEIVGEWLTPTPTRQWGNHWGMLGVKKLTLMMLMSGIMSRNPQTA